MRAGQRQQPREQANVWQMTELPNRAVSVQGGRRQLSVVPAVGVHSRVRNATSRPTLRVLLIEDNPGDAGLVQDDLEHSPETDTDIEVEWVSDLQAGLAALRASEFDAVIADLALPDSTPGQTLAHIRQACDTVAIIVLTGSSDVALRQEAFSSGAQDFFIKGNSATRFIGRAVLTAVERHRAHPPQRQLERWIAMTPDAVVVTLESGQVQFVNQAAEEFFGRSRAALFSETLVFSVDDSGMGELSVQRGDEARIGEIHVVRVDWRGYPALLATIRDCTERRAAQAELASSARLASIGTMAASVAHEINNPLAALLMNLDMALQVVLTSDLSRNTLSKLPQPLWGEGCSNSADLQSSDSTAPLLHLCDESVIHHTSDQRRDEQSDLLLLLRDANEAAERVRVIAGDLRNLARPSDERPGAVELSTVVDSTLRLATHETRFRSQVVVELDAALPPVMATVSRLGQVLLNLVVNAAQAIPAGAPERNEIAIRARRAGDDWVAIRISDTGCGIAAEAIPRLFRPFFTSKPSGVGTGLGLWICRRIVESFGGSIHVESRLGVGTTFCVMLRSAVHRAPSLVPMCHGHASAPPRARILVIDDEALVATAVARTLKPQHDVEIALSAAEARQRLNCPDAFDVILCDVNMPTMSGTQLFEQLEHEAPEVARSIVFFSGGGVSASCQAILDRVPNPILSKPVNRSELMHVIAETMSAKRES